MKTVEGERNEELFFTGERGMKQLIDKFRDHLKVERNASAHTLRSYSADLEQFHGYLKEKKMAQGNGGEVAAEKIDHLAIRAFLSSLYRDHKKSSLGRKLASLRSFLKYLVQEGYLRRNPAEIVATPRQEKPLPNFMPVDEAFALMETPDPSLIWGARDKAILETLYSTGMRVSELVGLCEGDLDSSLGIVRVFGKGGKERIVPIGEKALEALRVYLEKRDEAAPKAGEKGRKAPIFINTPRGAAHLPQRRAHPPEASRPGRNLAEDQPPRPAALLCDASARRGGGPAGDSGAPGPCQPVHDPALHPCERGQAYGGLRPGASPGEVRNFHRRERRARRE